MIGRSVQNPPPDGLGNDVYPGAGEDDGPTDDVGGEVGIGVVASKPLQATRRRDTSDPRAAVLKDNGA